MQASWAEGNLSIGSGKLCLCSLWLLWVPGGEVVQTSPWKVLSPLSPAQCTAGSPAAYSCGETCGLSLLLAWGSEQRGPARAQSQTLPFIFHFSFPPACHFFH